MLATILVHVPFILFSALQLPAPTAECRLDVLTPLVLEEQALAEFDSRVQTYLTLHRRVVRSFGPADLMDDEEGFLADELRAAIVAARPYSRQGDFFTPRVAEWFRTRIDAALLAGLARPPAGLYEPLPGEPGPAVNDRLPLVPGSLHWQALVEALPPLPAELAYAVWGRDLVLVDVPANLVIDVLSAALPEGARPGVVYQ
jgi:hypothetical protein